MKKFILLFLLSFFSHSLSAQNSFLISLENQKIDNPLIQYSFHELLLAQEEDTCLGVMTPSYNRIPTPVYFTSGLNRQLSALLERSMPTGQGTVPLIIRINRIYLYDTRTFEFRYGCLDLSLTFITIGSDSILREMFTANRTVTSRVYYEEQTIVTLIKTGFTECLSQFAERLKKDLIHPETADLQTCKKNALTDTSHIQCFVDSTRKKGIYLAFYDFRDQLPDTNYSFTIHPNYNQDFPELTRTHLKFRGDSPPKNAWGFTDGTHDYIRVGNSYCRLNRDSGIYYTWAQSKEYGEDIAASAVFGGVFFGVVGAALFGGITAAATSQKYIVKTKLDFFLGKLVPYEFTDYTKISSRVVIYYSKLSVPGEIQVLVNGKPICMMTPDSYLSLEFSCLYTEADLAFVSTGGKSLHEAIPLNLTKTSVYLAKIRSNEKLLFNKLHDQVRTDILSRKNAENTCCRADIR